MKSKLYPMRLDNEDRAILTSVSERFGLSAPKLIMGVMSQLNDLSKKILEHGEHMVPQGIVPAITYAGVKWKEPEPNAILISDADHLPEWKNKKLKIGGKPFVINLSIKPGEAPEEGGAVVEDQQPLPLGSGPAKPSTFEEEPAKNPRVLRALAKIHETLTKEDCREVSHAFLNEAGPKEFEFLSDAVELHIAKLPSAANVKQRDLQPKPPAAVPIVPKDDDFDIEEARLEERERKIEEAWVNFIADNEDPEVLDVKSKKPKKTWQIIAIISNSEDARVRYDVTNKNRRLLVNDSIVRFLKAPPESIDLIQGNDKLTWMTHDGYLDTQQKNEHPEKKAL